MSVSRTSRLFILPLILAGAATPVLAQDAADSGPRAASFLASPAKVSLPAFSGLAAPAVPPPQPPEPAPLVAVEPPAPAAPQPTPVPSAPVQAAPVTVAVAAPLSPRPPELLPKRDLVLLQGDSPESLGLQNADSLGADMWKGTSRTVADSLLSMAGVTASPVLNRLLLRLLATAATPPTGDEAPGAAGLTALRTQKLIALGDAPTAWGVASHAGPRIIDDLSVHDAAAVALAFGADDVCPRLADLAKARGGADWQKELFVCQLRADPDAAKAAIPGLRAENDRDDILLQIVEKSVLGEGKSLPTQLTPLTPARLEVLRMAGKPLPGDLYGHPDFVLAPALLKNPARQDVARLGLAERAAERGLIDADFLATLYGDVVLRPEALGSPLFAAESGSRLRALMAQAAKAEHDPQKRVAYAVKFMQSASPALLNGCGALLADMVDAPAPADSLAAEALTLAQIHMMAGRGNEALEWLRLARRHKADMPGGEAAWHALWPQFALAGLEAESDYTADLTQWLEAEAKASPDDASGMSAVLLLLDASGFPIPDAAWNRAVAAPPGDKKIALSPVLMQRLRAAASGGRRAETVVLAAALAGGRDISMPVAIDISRALRGAGFRAEAAIFAQQALALQMPAARP